MQIQILLKLFLKFSDLNQILLELLAEINEKPKSLKFNEFHRNLTESENHATQ